MSNDGVIKRATSDVNRSIDGSEKNDSYSNKTNGDTECLEIFPDYDVFNDFLWYNQHSPRYDAITYNDGNLGDYGCGIFAFTSILNDYFPDHYYSPEEIAKYFEDNKDIDDTVDSRKAFLGLAEHYGIENAYILGIDNVYEDSIAEYKDEIDSELDKGNRVIINTQNEFGRSSNLKGYWTKEGHYVALVGRTDDGKYIVCDSMSREKTMTPQEPFRIFGSGPKLPYAYFAVVFPRPQPSIDTSAGMTQPGAEIIVPKSDESGHNNS